MGLGLTNPNPNPNPNPNLNPNPNPNQLAGEAPRDVPVELLNVTKDEL